MQTPGDQQAYGDTQALHFPLRQFLLLCIPVMAVILATAYTVANLRISAALDHITATERISLRQLGGHVTADVSMSLTQLRALLREAADNRLLDAPPSRVVDELRSRFMTVANLNPVYQELCWIDESGHERIRVLRDGSNVHVMTEDGLQDVSDRAYFTATRTLLPGEAYISRLDPGLESESGDPSAKPVIRVATRVADSAGRNRGILIITITMRHLVETLQSVSEVAPDTGFAMVNQHGDWLLVSSRDGITDFQRNPGGLFAQTYPAVWKLIPSRPTGTASLADGLWTWEQLTPEEVVRRVVLTESGARTDMPVINSTDFSLSLLAHRPADAVVELRRDIYITTVLVATLLIIAYMWGLLLLLRSHVQEKQSHIAIAHANAHASHMERLRELEERFHLLVEASSVGMVVVDENGRIQMSNPAAESMLGYEKGEMTGLSVDSLLIPEQRDLHAHQRADYLRNPEVRMMGVGRKLQVLSADGQKIPVEVGLNPYMDHGRQVVLASIIAPPR